MDERVETVRRALYEHHGLSDEALAALDSLISEREEARAELQLVETKVAEYEAGRHPDDQFLAALDENARKQARIEQLEVALRKVRAMTFEPPNDVTRIIDAALSQEATDA